jgi:hypothetical protein
MTNIKNHKKDAYSQKERDIAISILNGMSIPKCAKKFKESEIKCQTIVNHFCMKSNYILFEKCQHPLYKSAQITQLRNHSKRFIDASKNLEKITSDSLIWALPDVPFLTLKPIWSRNKYTIRTINDLLKYSQRDLLRFPCLGKVGLKKLISSLAQYGFTIREN